MQYAFTVHVVANVNASETAAGYFFEFKVFVSLWVQIPLAESAEHGVANLLRRGKMIMGKLVNNKDRECLSVCLAVCLFVF